MKGPLRPTLRKLRAGPGRGRSSTSPPAGQPQGWPAGPTSGIGPLAYQALTTVLQTLVVIGIALAAGARFPGGVTGGAVTVLAAALISVIVASLSTALALLLRSQEALIGISQFLVLPLQFVSSAIMDTRFSPGTDWGLVWSRLGLRVALAAVMAWLATRAFGSYQRSL